ncbi:MAG TPA: XRE family transcriptional regulator [Tepidisphaeraceae bacterium]|jgi:SOS-response transcriptional repressor LexA/DNA-binding Xre family transcriptional regulator
MDPLGTRIRIARRRHGLTLDELAAVASISKPYLSLIETGRVKHPPSDEKLQRIEQALGFAPGELVGQAHLMRTPRDIRVMLEMLAKEGQGLRRAAALGATTPAATGPATAAAGTAPPGGAKASAGAGVAAALALKPQAGGVGVNLDAAYLSGVLQQLVDTAAGNIETIQMNTVPVVNRVSAGYPKDFTDLSYPRGKADAYVGCPDLADPDAFAARVFGDSMRPKYGEGDIVIFSPAAHARHGDDCFVRFEDGQTTFKRVFFEKDSKGNSVLRLQPRNEKYRPRVVKPDAVNGLYRAMFRYQPIDTD